MTITANPLDLRSAVRQAFAMTVLIGACAARAEPVTFLFEATLTQDPFGLSQIGAPVSGRYSFESSAVDDIADPTQGSYTSTGPAFGFSVVVGDTAYATPAMLNIGTQSGAPGLVLVTGVADGLTLELVLRDDTGLAVVSDALPLTAPRLDAFAVHEFRLFAPDAEFTATLQQLRASVPGVPEPASAALLLAGLAAMAARRSRRTSPA